MCDFGTFSGLALMGLSTALNTVAQGRVDRARDDAMAAERIRQQSLDREVAALNTQSQDRYEEYEPQRQQKADSLADFFTGPQGSGADVKSALPTSRSDVTVQEGQKQQAAAKAFTDQQGRALGSLRSLSDLLTDTSLLQARDAAQVGQLGGFKRGSSGLLGMELEEANKAGGGIGVLADVVGGVGGLVTNSSLAGKGPASLFSTAKPKVKANTQKSYL